MMSQSTHHIMMMEPEDFYSNPQTRATNQYQHDNPDDVESIRRQAVAETRALRDALVEAGVMVTTVRGQSGCPDDVFCNNWLSTHSGGGMILYAMLADNRRLERRADILDVLGRSYNVIADFIPYETQGKFLESTGSLAMDRINGRIYSGLSARTDLDLAAIAAQKLGYELVTFNTANHAGKPVYHTDLLMYIGTGYAGFCAETLLPEDRDRVLDVLSSTHEVIEITMEQMRNMCGNALEVIGADGKRYLAMSSTAYRAYSAAQKDALLRHVEGIIHADIPTIEKYGGGSARCMLLELF